MSNIGNKYKVGVLAMVAFALLMIGLIALGSFKYFRQTYGFMTAVDSSVQGLEKGAKVKIKGVSIGSVTKIQVNPDMKVIYIFMNFDRDAFASATSSKAVMAHLTHKEVLDIFSERVSEHVEKGLRCQLQYGDITGTMFVDLAMFDPKEYPPRDFDLPDDHPPYVPSVPTATIGSIIDEIHKATQNIAKMDLQKISDQLNVFLEKANKFLNDDEIKKIIKDVQSISNNLDQLLVKVNDVMDKKYLEKVSTDLNKAFDNFNQTLASIEKLSEETRNTLKEAKLAETTEKARTLLENSNTMVKNLDDLRKELRLNIEDMEKSLQSAKELFDYLERNPNALISGKPDKPVVDAE